MTPLPSRQPLYARNVVATSQPLAAEAGLSMLSNGGNAVDAAIAAAVALTVVEPTSNGIGSDLFAIVHDGRTLTGLNASGRSPARWTTDHFARAETMALTGWDSVTVPGCVAGWRDLHERFGKLSFEDLLVPAIGYAREGYPVSPITAHVWALSEKRFGEFPEFRRVFLPAPSAGEVWRSEDHARTLEEVGRTKGESFYRGSLAEKIAAAAMADGGAMTADDLAEHEDLWLTQEQLLSGEGCGIRLHEMPPNGQGIAAQLALQIAEAVRKLHPPKRWYDADGLHLQIEAMKLAFADLHAHVSDPGTMQLSPADLLDPAYAAERARLIDPRQAKTYSAGAPRHGGTVYLTAADASGMMVSLIQSNYYGFGSGIVVPGTGIALQNRGAGFVLTPGHPNQVGPRKRPFHTIIPGFVTDPATGTPLMSFGVMGGPMQAQGHLQMILRNFGDGQGLQQACDAPRWRFIQGREVWHEAGFDPSILSDLASRGHELKENGFLEFGGAQLIRRLANGCYEAASDPRKDGQAVAF